MLSDDRHDYDAVLTTFAHPRHELMATGQVFDGEEEVRRYFELSRTPFRLRQLGLWPAGQLAAARGTRSMAVPMRSTKLSQ